MRSSSKSIDTYVIWDVKLLHQITLQKHPNRGFTRVHVVQFEIDKSEAVQIEIVCRRYVLFDQLFGGVVAGRGMIRQTFEGDFLLRHQFTSVFVHLGVVDAEAAENRERLEQGYVAIGERGPVVFVDQLCHSCKRSRCC